MRGRRRDQHLRVLRCLSEFVRTKKNQKYKKMVHVHHPLLLICLIKDSAYISRYRGRDAEELSGMEGRTREGHSRWERERDRITSFLKQLL